MPALQGKRVYITGGTGGIGRATARHILAQGGSVFLSDVNDDVADVAAELGAAGGAPADVTDAEAVRRSLDAAAEAMGGVDGLFLNAGIEGKLGAIADLDPAEFRKVFEVNVLGVLHGLQAGIPHLLQADGGSVVMTASVASFIGSPGLGPYCTAKHALVGLMRTAAQEYGPQGVRINTVNPGPVDNRMMESIEHQAAPGHEESVRAGFLGRIPLGRYARNEEIAAMVAWLLQDEASYCHGQTFLVDGGMRSG